MFNIMFPLSVVLIEERFLNLISEIIISTLVGFKISNYEIGIGMNSQKI